MASWASTCGTTASCCCTGSNAMPSSSSGRSNGTASTATATRTTCPSTTGHPCSGPGQGVRLLGRTTVECTRDVLADAIGHDVAGLVPVIDLRRGLRVIDLFAGSGNTLFWLTRHLPDARVVGFELDDAVFALTRQNIAALNLPIALDHIDFDAGLSRMAVPDGDLIVVVIAP